MKGAKFISRDGPTDLKGTHLYTIWEDLSFEVGTKNPEEDGTIEDLRSFAPHAIKSFGSIVTYMVERQSNMYIQVYYVEKDVEDQKGKGKGSKMTGKPIMDGKLTKKFLMGLPEGAWLISNVGDSPYEPVFAETVLPLEEREGQWKRIVAASVSQQMCYVFPSKDDHRAWVASIVGEE